MKKLSVILLAALLALSLVSCGEKSFNYMEEDLSAYVTAPEYKNLTVTYPAVEAVTDEEVAEHAFDHLGHMEEKPASVERAAELGDIVNIDYVGTMDGVEFDGGTDADTDLELGSGAMIDGFEDGIVGMTAGETKTIDVTFPEDYDSEELAGKPAQFAITLNAVYDIEAVHAAVREEMEAEREETIENTKNQYAWTVIVESAPISAYPEAAVKKLANDLYDYYEAVYYQYTQYGLTMENFGITEESCEQDARDTFREELVLYSIVKANGYTVTDEEYEAKVADLVAQQNEGLDEASQITVNDYKNSYSRQSVETKIYYEKVMADVLATATFVEE